MEKEQEMEDSQDNDKLDKKSSDSEMIDDSIGETFNININEFYFDLP